MIYLCRNLFVIVNYNKTMKKYLIILISLVIVVASLATYYFYNNKPQIFVFSTTIKAIPKNASLIIETKNLYTLVNTLKNNNDIWKQVSRISELNNVNKNIKFLDSLITRNNEIKKALTNNSVFISLHSFRREDFDCLFAVKLNSSFDENKVVAYLNELLTGKGAINERLYNSTKIYEVTLNNGNNFNYSISKGIFIFSFSYLLVEESIRQLHNDISLLNDEGFNKILNTSGKNVDANIYVNYRTLPKLIFNYFNDNIKKTILSFKDFADWTELDVNIKNNSINLNGFTYSSDSEDINYLNIFLNQEPQEFKIDKILPASTSTFILLGIEDLQKYSNDYKKYKLQNNDYYSYDKDISNINKQTDIYIIDLFNKIYDREACIFQTDEKNTYVIIGIKSKSQAEEELTIFLKRYAKKNKKNFNSFVIDYKIDNETNLKIYQSPFNNIPKLLFGDIFSQANCKYFTFYDNYILFGSTVKSLSDVIRLNMLEKTLSNDDYYKKFNENLSSKSNFYFYSNYEGTKINWSGYLNNDLNKGYKDYKDIFSKFNGIAIQFSSSKGMMYNNIFINYNPISIEKPPTTWESHLDAEINMKPFIVNNPSEEGNEIFVQDIKNNVYLINKSGRILWKKLLPEKILSNIYQIDFYANKKAQLVFSSLNYIYIIDRIGNYIDRYPMKLQAPATNGVSVIDPENKRKYIMFIGCRDKKIYNFSKNGNVIKEWKFDKTDNYVRSEIQYCKSDKKEYIVFNDSLKTYILDLKGNFKAKVSDYFPKSKNNKYNLESKGSKSKDRLITTNVSGTVYYIYFDGTAEHNETKGYSGNHYFLYSDIDNNKNKEYIYFDKNQLNVFTKDNSLIYSYNFFDNNNTKPEICYLSNKETKIGIVSKSENKIYFINKDGTIYKGFPLIGKTEFVFGVLDKNKKVQNIIVGGNNNFLYNYEIH